MDQRKAPLFEALRKHVQQNPISFHVPGHKNGSVFSESSFSNLLSYDLTELPHLDDLHQPEGVILQAEQLASELYQTQYTFFLVNGSTVGNLAMVMSVCQPGDEIIVQRNSHKSVFNALELAGAKPIFVSPNYDERTERFSYLDSDVVANVIENHPHAKAVFLSYPDYFGTTYEIEPIISKAHQVGMAVLVDEAHGAHFPLSDQFPQSALELGADLVVHSAHKTLPAMTMGSFLHMNNEHVSYETVKHFLQMLQSSSPSYPIMASLDLARQYVSELSGDDFKTVVKHIESIREALNNLPSVKVMPILKGVDDPLKITLSSTPNHIKQVEKALHDHRVFPEMVEQHQLLLMVGLRLKKPNLDWILSLKDSLLLIETIDKHDTMTSVKILSKQSLEYSYQDLKRFKTSWATWEEAVGKLAAQSITPYPPGIPVLIKGERIEEDHLKAIEQAQKYHASIQYNGRNLKEGIEIYIE
ncbi:aminotransferase class I/II-fold pyridoxal phosphate-dependent enzyme [Aquisalibacillus elongatus]|uniref:Lysine decarboxylase n=1 Tax=Aquisalibacillus elongatus TaxID=485577 RepID=A0A3N5BN79_9BACI|nr:aminotransferase class V-fold PLP-dependent enzyme [Aquisalibacillus elongatus]RPF51178.1 lysine decarboxylase [Aquisalibacillus elongatus]